MKHSDKAKDTEELKHIWYKNIPEFLNFCEILVVNLGRDCNTC